MIAKNNIFNIRATATQQWQGQTGARKGFVEFDSADSCIRAWLRLMRTYRVKYRLTTIRTIVARYAPSGENDTWRYIDYVGKTTGIDVDRRLTTPQDYCEVGCSMAFMETGTIVEPKKIYDIMNQSKNFVTFERL